MRIAALAMMALLLVENTFCETKPIFSKLEDEFIYTTLAFSTVYATSAGYHRHQGASLDRQLDDFSAASLDRQKKFYENIRGRLHTAANSTKLSPEDRADYDIMMGQIELALLDLDTIQLPAQPHGLCRADWQCAVQSAES